MHYYLTLLLLFLSSLCGFGQTTIKQQSISDVFVDNFQSIYVLSESEVVKYDKKGQLLFQYSNGVYGKIHSIDASNPLRVLVFFRESNAIVYLNQQLAELSDPIEIDGLGDYQAQLACIASNGGFWIYDEIEQAIIHFSNNRSETTRSQNILSLSEVFIANNLQEQHNKLYLSSKENNSLLFDQFGTYLQKLPIIIQSSIQSNGKIISFWNGDEWTEYNPLTKNTTPIFKNEDTLIKKILRINNQRIIQYKDSIVLQQL